MVFVALFISKNIGKLLILSKSVASMFGNIRGSYPKPGAISLAHHGILFLDELPEFNRNVLEALREPLEARYVDISRVNQQVRFPADCLLVTAMNPSPSGFFADDPLGRCCQLQNYLIITKLNKNNTKLSEKNSRLHEQPLSALNKLLFNLTFLSLKLSSKAKQKGVNHAI